VRKDVKKMCQATTVAEQDRIWTKKLRPILLNKIMVKGFLGNPYVVESLTTGKAISARVAS
jgi:betaine lipid synthase